MSWDRALRSRTNHTFPHSTVTHKQKHFLKLTTSENLAKLHLQIKKIKKHLTNQRSSQTLWVSAMMWGACLKSSLNTKRLQIKSCRFYYFPVSSCLLILNFKHLLVQFSEFLPSHKHVLEGARRMRGWVCEWLTDELVLHSLQQRLVGIFRLHSSGAFPSQHGANQMLSTSWQVTHKSHTHTHCCEA